MRWRRRNPFGRRNPLSAAEEAELGLLESKTGALKSAFDKIREKELKRLRDMPGPSLSAEDWAGHISQPGPLSSEDWAGWVKEPTKEEKKAAKKAKVSAKAVAKKGDGRSKQSLLAEAKMRQLRCRSNMSKPELAAALVRNEYLGKPASFGGRAKPWDCKKEYRGYRTGSMLANEAKDLGVSLFSKSGPRAGKRKSRESLKAGISKAKSRKNPWWKGLLGGSSEGDNVSLGDEHPVMSNPRGRLGMAKRFFNVGRSYSGTVRAPGGKNRKISIKFKNPKKGKRRKNPFDIGSDLIGGISIKDVGVIAASMAGLNILQNAIERTGLVNFSGLTRLPLAGAKLAAGLGGVAVANRMGVQLSPSTERMIKLSAVASAVSDLAIGFADKVVAPIAQALGLGEIIAHPASTGRVMLTELGELSYNPYALGAAVGPDGRTWHPGSALGQTYGPQYGMGEVIANAASQGGVMTTSLGYSAGEYGQPIPMLGLGGLEGAFYAGNVNLPRGAAEHPDFMNQVPGRSDLSAVPDFMR